MPNFILAYHPGKMPEDPEEGARLRTEWKAWVERLGDDVVNPGTPLGRSRTVSAGGVSQDGGPNPLMRFSVVNADNIDAALTIARSCPHLRIGTIEVAEMMQM